MLGVWCGEIILNLSGYSCTCNESVFKRPSLNGSPTTLFPTQAKVKVGPQCVCGIIQLCQTVSLKECFRGNERDQSKTEGEEI